MALRVVTTGRLRARLKEWALPDHILVDVYLRFQRLGEDFNNLVRRRPDGLNYSYVLVDPENRFCEHHFHFILRYHQNEEAVEVFRGSHRKRDIL